MSPPRIKQEHQNGGNGQHPDAMMMDVDDPLPDLASNSNTARSLPSAAGNHHVMGDLQLDDEDYDDGDHVVQEIPVYISPQFAERLHLMQYPLQVSSSNLSSATASANSGGQQQPQQSLIPTAPESAKIRQRHCQLEIDVPLPGGDVMDGHGSYAMQTRTFQSHTVPVTTHMAVGRLIPTFQRRANNSQSLFGSNSSKSPVALHLVPLSRITQLRPSFSHVDEHSNDDDAMDVDGSDMDDDGDNTATAAARMPIAIVKKETERQADMRKNSYAYKKAEMEKEEWTPLVVRDVHSARAAQILGSQIPCPANRRTVSLVNPISRSNNNITSSTATNSSNRYVRSLNYMPKASDMSAAIDLTGDDTTTTTPSIMLNDNDPFPSDDPTAIVQRLVQLLHQGCPTPYSILRSHFPTSVTDESLFTALGSCAILVQGNFCLSTKYIPFPKPELALARSFLLFLFQTVRIVHRERFQHVFSENVGDSSGTNGSSVGQHNNDTIPDVMDNITIPTISPNAIEMILEQVGRRTKNSGGGGEEKGTTDYGEGWVLKVDEDKAFGQIYPVAMGVHNQYWEEQKKVFEPLMKRYRDQISLV